MAWMFKAFLLLTVIAELSSAMPTNSSNTINFCNTLFLGANGKQCYPCNAGYHKTGDCVEDGEQARCTPCSPGTFQPGCSVATSCAPCSKDCKDRRLVKSRECTPFADIECTCTVGHYWAAENSNTADGVCLAHSPCNSGFGMTVKGNAYKDTVCEPCRAGATFSTSPSFEPCRLCTVCKQYNATCTPVSDASCSTSGPEISGKCGSVDGDTSKEGLAPVAIVFIAIGGFSAICFAMATIIGYVRRRTCCQKRGRQGSADVESQTGIHLDNMQEPFLPTKDQDQRVGTIQSSDDQANAEDDIDTNGDSNVDAYGIDADRIETPDEMICKNRHSDNQAEPQQRQEEILVGTSPIGEDDKRIHSMHMTEAVNGLQEQNIEDTEINRIQPDNDGFARCPQNQNVTQSTEQRDTTEYDEMVPEDQTAFNYTSQRGRLTYDVIALEDQNAAESVGQGDTAAYGAPALIDKTLTETTDQSIKLTFDDDVPEDQTSTESTGQRDTAAADVRFTEDQNASKYVGKRDTAAGGLRTHESEIHSASSERGSNNHDASEIGLPRRNENTDKNVWWKPFTFIADMAPNDFKRFFRSLVDNRNVDNWIEVAKQEHNTIYECQYQLMRKVLEQKPSLSHDEVIRALRDVELNRIAEDYGKSFIDIN